MYSAHLFVQKILILIQVKCIKQFHVIFRFNTRIKTVKSDINTCTHLLLRFTTDIS